MFDLKKTPNASLFTKYLHSRTTFKMGHQINIKQTDNKFKGLEDLELQKYVFSEANKKLVG